VILVLETEVDPDGRYFVPEIRRHLEAAGATVRTHPYADTGGRPAALDGGQAPSSTSGTSSRSVSASGQSSRSVSASGQSSRSVDAVVISGSTAGVYETDAHPWMDDLRAVVRDLRDARIPTLGICFGHQLINDAFGGTVEHRGLRKGLETVRFGDDPLFEGVGARVPMVHGDVVVDLGDGLTPIATADYHEYVATRHREAPVWTVQYHPELTASLLPRIDADFGWPDDRDFDGVTVERTLANFAHLAGVT